MASRADVLGIATALATFGSQFAPPGTGIAAANARAIDQIQASLQAEVIREQRKKANQGNRLSKLLTLGGGIAGSFIPIPGVGTAVGAAIGTAIGSTVGKGIGTAIEGGDVGRDILNQAVAGGLGVGGAAAGQKLTALRGQQVNVPTGGILPQDDISISGDGSLRQPAITLQSVATRTSDEINRLANENRANTGQTAQATQALIGQQGLVQQGEVQAPLTGKEKALGAVVQSIPELIELLRDPGSELPDIRQFGLTSDQLKEVNQVLKDDKDALQAEASAEKNRAQQLDIVKLQNEARIKAAEISAEPGLIRARQEKQAGPGIEVRQRGSEFVTIDKETGDILSVQSIGPAGVTPLQRAGAINDARDFLLRIQELQRDREQNAALIAGLLPAGPRREELIGAINTPPSAEGVRQLNALFDELVNEGAFPALTEVLTAPEAGSAATLGTSQGATDTAAASQRPAPRANVFDGMAEFNESFNAGLLPPGTEARIGKIRVRITNDPLNPIQILSNAS